jgi:hypothetical protein
VAAGALSVRRALLEQQLQSAAGMLLRRLPCALICSSLLLACGQAAAPRSASAPVGPAAPGYLTIAPDVSVSRTARPYEAKQEALDPNADVMAEILAIPPGR